MSLVVPAESTETVHHETDRVERILVVDDDVRLRTLLQRFLEDKGFVVYNCFEGQRKPFVVTLSDNSSPAKGIINMVIYKDK